MICGFINQDPTNLQILMTRTERSRDLRGSEIEILESIRSAVPEMGRSAKLRIKLFADQQLKDVQI